MSAIEWFNSGIAFLKEGKYHKAIKAFQQAVEEGGGKFPYASNNLGNAYSKLGKHDEAKKAYQQAIKDNGGKFPTASIGLGNAYFKLGKYDEAIEAYQQAIEDNEGKYPLASYNLGKAYAELGKYDEAKEAYQQAIKDNGGKYPYASNGLGLAYYELGKYDEAIEAYQQAIEDNGGKYPDASHNLGSAYAELEKYEEAIKAFQQAIKDNGGKHPLASYHLGLCYKDIDKYEYSIHNIHKALQDYEDDIDLKIPIKNFIGYCYYTLAQSYLGLGDRKKAKAYVFKAHNTDSRNYEFNELILNRFTSDETSTFYKNRLEYLGLDFGDRIIQQSSKPTTFQTNDPIFKNWLNTLNSVVEPKMLFKYLLKIEEFSFPESISFQDRLRVYYLLSFIEEDYAGCFHTIDTLLDTSTKLDDLDHFFYFASSYYIGEPVKELKYFSTINVNETSSVGKIYKRQVQSLVKSINDKNYLDEYLLDIQTPFSLDNISFDRDEYHSWVVNILHSISNASPYQIPITEEDLRGFKAQFLSSLKKDVPEYSNKDEWKNFITSLKKEPLDYELIVGNIRKAIQSGIRYTAILAEILPIYDDTEDEILKHNLNILLSATLLSQIKDNNKIDLFNTTKEIAITELLNNLVSLLLGGISFLYSHAFGVAIAVIVKIGMQANTKKRENNKNEEFKYLLEDIKG